MKKSHVILCLCLIAFGVGVCWQLVSLYLKMHDWRVFLLAIPLLPLAIIMPIYSGIAYLIEMIRTKGDDNHAPQETEKTP